MDLEVYKKAASIQAEITRLENVKADLSSSCVISIDYHGRITDLTYDENIRRAMLETVKIRIADLVKAFEAI